MLGAIQGHGAIHPLMSLAGSAGGCGLGPQCAGSQITHMWPLTGFRFLTAWQTQGSRTRGPGPGPEGECSREQDGSCKASFHLPSEVTERHFRHI